MKLKLIIVVCIVLVGVAKSDKVGDVEYDNSEEDTDKKNEIDTESPVKSSSDSDEVIKTTDVVEDEPQTCSRDDKTYNDKEQFYQGVDDCELCQCRNGQIHCSDDICVVNEHIVTSEEPNHTMTEKEDDKDENIEESKDKQPDVVYDEDEGKEVKDDVEEEVKDDVVDEVKDDVKEEVEDEVKEEVKDDIKEEVEDEVKDDINDASEDTHEEDIVTKMDDEDDTTTEEATEKQPQSSENLEEHHQQSSSENRHDNREPQEHQTSENMNETNQQSSTEHDNNQHQNSEHETHQQSSSENRHDNREPQEHQTSENMHETNQQSSSKHDNNQHQNSEHETHQQSSSENRHDNRESQEHQTSENRHDNRQHHQEQQSSSENRHEHNQEHHQDHQIPEQLHENHQTDYHENPVIGAHSMQSNHNDNYNDNDYEFDHDDNYEEPREIPHYHDLPGQYCARKFPRASNGKCCDDRSDSCSVPILSTLCYCDEFCSQHNNPDCCPDFQSHCKGEAPNPIVSCEVDGVYFTPFDPPQVINCNTCKCQHDGKALCEIDTCLSNTEMINNINYDQDISWTAKNYSQFFGRKYNEGLELRLGTFEPVRHVKSMSRLSNSQKPLPNSFNSLEKWPGLISEVRDQGWCGSSWAVSTASVASDRFSVKSKGLEMVEMAPQQLLSCAKRQQGCTGGHLDIAWNYFRRWGGVDEECYPYEGKVTNCRVPDKRASTLKSLGCSLPSEVARTDLYKMGPAYSLNNETDIMWEIYHHGPVQATMRVHHDFFTYQTGVYQRSTFGTDQRSGFHSVRLIGWGQEDDGYENLKYWIAANSWGKWWGEKGFFRILRGTNECEIENYVLSSLADIQDTKVNGRRQWNPRHNRAQY